MTSTRHPGEGLDRTEPVPADRAGGIALAWHRLDTMTGVAVHELIRLREAVFVVEQRCAYQEADALDAIAWHLLARFDGILVGCLRVIPPATATDDPAIGRVLTRIDQRGRGIARALMQEAMIGCARRWPGRAITLSAQVAVQSFYEALDFVAEGPEYLEDDIAHIAMRRTAAGR